jgi:hypothetical protein
MPTGNRLQQLIDAGVTEKVSDFSNDAKQVINALSEDEFNCLLTIRDKIHSQGGQPALDGYDRSIILMV